MLKDKIRKVVNTASRHRGCAQRARWAALGFNACLIWCMPPANAQTPEAETTLRPGQFVQPTEPAAVSPPTDFETKEAFSATYVGADIPSVVNQILGDFLKVGYSIAPDVSGVVTMRVENLRSRLAAISMLTEALKPLGIVVVDHGTFVTIGRSGANQPSFQPGGAIGPGQPPPMGGGVVALTPRYIAPSQLGPLVTPFAPAGSIVAMDDARRVLMIRGDQSVVSAISTAAKMFDVDWFAQVSVGSFDLRNVTPHDLIQELRTVLGPQFGTVDMVPVPRLSKLIVLSQNPDMVGIVRGWIERLDQPASTLSPGLLVYRARNSSAEALAKSLRESSTTSTTGATGVLGPGAEPQSPTQLNPPATGRMPQNAMSVTWNAGQNAVIVRGSSDELAEAKSLLEALDLPAPQVLIEAAIVEVTLDDELQFGVNWKGIEDRFTGVFTDAANGQVATNFPGFALTYVNTDIQAALNVLASITKVEVVSRPSVVSLNNESATLQVGDQVPIVTQSAISVTDPDAPIVNQTDYRDTGVILTVTPRVRSGGMVELEVAQEVSQVARTTSSGIDSPTIQQRKIESKLLVPSGKSVALGGLISTSQTGNVSGIPLLMDIPLLGHLFRSDTRLTERTELVVFVTPRILMDGAASVEATDEMRKAFLKLEERLGQR